MEKVQLDKELLIRIGKEHDEHSISWDILKKLGDSLEDLILTLAKYNTEHTGSINLENFKLDFSGFYNGSPVPAFKLISTRQSSIFNEAAIRNSVISDFNHLLVDIDKGNYQNISDSYNTIEAKNDVIKKVYDFTNSAGSTPISVVKRSGNGSINFKEIYRLRRLDKDIYNKLVVKAPVVEEEDKILETTAFAKVKLKQNKAGKISRTTSALYIEKEVALSLKFDQIVVSDKKYVLNFPILFQLIKEGKGTIIEQEQLDLFAAGLTLQEAKLSLFDQFDHTYQRLNQLSDKQLSNHLLKVKSFYNIIVKEIL